MNNRERRARLMYARNQSPEVNTTFMHHEQSRGIYDPEYIASVYPVDPRTGYPRTDLGTLADPKLTDYEREKVMQRLQRIDGTYLPKDLSDEEIFELIPSRFFTNDPVDVQIWRNYLSEHVVPNMKDPTPVIEAVGEPENEPNNNEPNNE